MFHPCFVCSTVSGPVGKFVESHIKQTKLIIHVMYTTITLMFSHSRLDNDESVDISTPAPAEQDTTHNTSKQLHPAKSSITQETIAEERDEGDSSLIQDQGTVQSSSSREETNAQQESCNGGTSLQHSKAKVRYCNFFLQSEVVLTILG